MANYTKVGAIRTVVLDTISHRKRSRDSYKRVKKALAALGLDAAETQEALRFLNYHDLSGMPFKYLQPK